jgi:hypothetical protein
MGHLINNPTQNSTPQNAMSDKTDSQRKLQDEGGGKK